MAPPRSQDATDFAHPETDCDGVGGIGRFRIDPPRRKISAPGRSRRGIRITGALGLFFSEAAMHGLVDLLPHKLRGLPSSMEMRRTDSKKTEGTPYSNCHRIAPNYEIVSLGSIESGSRLLCGQCFKLSNWGKLRPNPVTTTSPQIPALCSGPYLAGVGQPHPDACTFPEGAPYFDLSPVFP